MRIEGSIEVDEAEIGRLLFGPSGKAVRLVARMASDTATAARVRAPVDSGRLRQRTNAQAVPRVVGNTVSSSVVSDVNYAAAVHEGTKPHVIVPKNRKALRFEIGGEVVYATRVNHPGTKGRPFLRDALTEQASRHGFIVSR